MSKTQQIPLHYSVMMKEVLYYALKIVYNNCYHTDSLYLSQFFHKRNYKDSLNILYTNKQSEYLRLKQLCSTITVVDATFGCGGHSRMLLHWGFKVIAIDCDPDSKKYADQLTELYDDKFKFYLGRFGETIKQIDMLKIRAILLADLGLSTMQLKSDRGFSYITDSNLSMNMANNNIVLSDYLNTVSLQELTNLLQTEEVKKYRYVAQNIINYRLSTPIKTTKQLVEASKIYQYSELSLVFQAFRRHINKEHQETTKLLQFTSKHKIPMIIISFHSLEHKLVGRYAPLYLYKFISYPTQQEIGDNPPSRSAQIRCYYNFINS